MFAKVIQALKDAPGRGPSPPIDPAQFDDPVATQTEWTPVASGGANFRTQKLVAASSHRLEFRPTFGMRLFAGVFFLAGLGAVIAGVYALAVGFDGHRLPGFILTPVGLMFGGVGGAIYYITSRPKVFDMDTLWYWKGKRPFDRAEVERRKDAAPLDVVHAVQLIRELCGDDDPYYSFEINLVMHDGSRVNVVDHGDPAAIRKDAQRLGQFIGVPVWDATRARTPDGPQATVPRQSNAPH